MNTGEYLRKNTYLKAAIFETLANLAVQGDLVFLTGAHIALKLQCDLCSQRLWSRDSKSLRIIDADFAEFGDGLLVLHQFGDRLHADQFGYPVDGNYFGELHLVAQDIENDIAVDFQKLHLEAAYLIE